jgi:hypothetical protein
LALSILLLISFFDSFLFPRDVLHERQFNPAYLHERKLEVLLTSEVRFQLSELRTFELYSQINRYSLKVASFGNDIYRENIFEFGFGFPVGQSLSLGLNAAGLNVWIKDVSNDFTYTLKAGGQFENDPFLVSVLINNINVPRISSFDYVPISYSLRLEYAATRILRFDFAMRGVEAELPFYNFGLVLSPHNSLLLSLKVNTKPLLLEYGVQLLLGKMLFNYAGNRHQQLGLTHNIGLGFVR